MIAGVDVGTITGTVLLSVSVGVGVALVGLAVLGWLLRRSRQRAEDRLDLVQSRVLQMAVALSEQTRASGNDARIRLIRAAHAAMSEQEARERRERRS